MLEKFIPKLVQEMELGDTTLGAGVPGSYALPLDEGLSITMTDIPEGFILKSNVVNLPAAKQENFVTQAMLANLFGQGTRGGILGLSPDGSVLTLTHVVDYPVDYNDFHAILEDFINMVDFWRDETNIA